MFGLFSDPFDYRYAPKHVVRAYDPFFGYYYKPVGKNYDPFGINSLGAYMHAMDQAFNQMFGYYDEEDEEQETSQEKKETQNKEEKVENINTQETNTKENDNKVNTETPKKEVKKTEQPHYWSRSSVFSSHSSGGVEEIREKTYDSKTGETVESQTRRIGDRWCRIDTVTDKEGSSKSKETWHNVADDEMEKFKKEWVSRRGLNSKANDQKAIETKQEDKQGETKPEEKKEEKPETNQ